MCGTEARLPADWASDSVANGRAIATEGSKMHPLVFMEIVKSYVRESLSSLTPRHFWALSTTSLMLTCLNSHLLTYVPLPLTTSRHRQCLISHSFHYCIPAWCTLHCDYVSHPHWASTSILDIFTTSSLMLYACRSLSSQILFRNDPKLHPTSQIAPVNVLMPIFDSI